MPDQFQSNNQASAINPFGKNDLARLEFERLYQLYLTKYHTSQASPTASPSLFDSTIGIAKNAFGKGLNVFKINYKNSQYQDSTVSHVPVPSRKYIPVVTQQARDRIEGFKAKIQGVSYQPQSRYLQPVPVRIVRPPQTPISWFTMGENSLSRPEFDPYQQNKSDFTVSKMSKNLWPLSQEIFERPKDNQILNSNMMTGLIYEQPKIALIAKLKQFVANVKLPNINPFRYIPRLQISGVSVVLFIFSGLFAGSIWVSGNTDLLDDLGRFSPSQIAGATERISEDPETIAFNEWFFQQTGTKGEKDGDFDNDQLTNFEEFKLGTDPSSPHTCNPDKTDIEVLLEVKDPVTCEDLDMENDEVVKFYSYILSLPEVIDYMGVGQSLTAESDRELNKDTGTVVANTDLISLFGVSDYKEIGTLTIEQLEQEAATKSDKIEVLRTIDKIDKYVQKHRSFEIYDRNYEPPVNPAVYLDVSRKYNVPLKYVLTIARLESRFGTDRFTNNGNLTRPGEHQNIYSMGLTDSGSNITYKSWEDGVAAFGKWYQRLEQRGVKDCTKWKIYNPNGDYCGKVEKLADQIQVYLDS
jgi:hypothetical protein